ncbi:hypothetical protein MWU61_12980 [Loktanella sp. F6476L]|uniref:hypothetical protein n=1 Tax=Loktanella sp. F6476L TaxID=2926405 RepID=UPI001FF5D420|nr:hypothetical protein [Loktanella sp. F6476L]MCK0121460.1 hypothetical protein [Loktanella sp. F6476L]
MKPVVLTFVFGTFAATLGPQVHAQSAEPLSAIDWLSQSVEPAKIPTRRLPTAPAVRDEAPVASGAGTPSVTTTPLDGPSPDPIGLLSSDLTGLPATLWSASEEATLIALLQAQQTDGLPAMQDLLKTLLMAEADPPLGASAAGGLFQARVDKLLDIGAIEPAQALLEQAGAETPDLFRRWFDVALLTGSEDMACRTLQARIDVAPTYAARIFCLARGGDWNAAALSLNTHRVLGDISEDEEALLSRFLDPELYEGEPPLGTPERISPLVFRLYEAIGERMTTNRLPRAFAHADLRNQVGWKSQLEAAERLARHGAIAGNVLFALYTSRRPSASGGVWDRADAIQDFDTAIRDNDPDAIAATLPAAWDAMKFVKTEIAFAQNYGPNLVDVPLEGQAAEVAAAVGLLSSSYEATAIARSDGDAFLVALARGVPQGVEANDPLRRAIADAFGEVSAPDALKDMVDNGQLGEAILRSIALVDVGMSGDYQTLTEALSFLRSVGLEDVARRAGLQLLLLERPT